MKKLGWIIGLILLVFIGDRIGGLILESMALSSHFRYSRLYKNTANADILLVGNSRGLMFFQPEIEKITGASTFNLSYNALSIDLAKNLIADYLDKYPAPKVLVLDVTMCDRENDQLISGFASYRSSSPRIENLLKERVPKTYYGGMFSKLFNYNSEIFHRALYYQNRDDKDWLLDRVINENLIDNIGEEKEVAIKVSDYVLKNLIEIVQMAAAKGLTIKLVINPYYPPFIEKITNLTETKALIERATKLKVHDFSGAVSNPKSFGDYQHLNKLGAKEYMLHLLERGIFASF